MLNLFYFLFFHFQNIDVVCVAKPEELDTSRLTSCYVTGWGRRTESKHGMGGGVDGLLWVVRWVVVLMEWFGWCNTLTDMLSVVESDHSVVLKEIKVPLWRHSVCNEALQSQFGTKYSLPDTAVCAGAEGRDACDVRKF